MQLTFAHVVLACAWTSVALARPAEEAGLSHLLNSRALSPDNTCGNVFNGNNKGYTCDPNAPDGGPCCSAYGFCGAAQAYCTSGCQKDFGTCSGSDTIPPIGPFQCGPTNANNKCPSGLCCSQGGWCGNTTVSNFRTSFTPILRWYARRSRPRLTRQSDVLPSHSMPYYIQSHSNTRRHFPCRRADFEKGLLRSWVPVRLW